MCCLLLDVVIVVFDSSMLAATLIHLFVKYLDQELCPFALIQGALLIEASSGGLEHAVLLRKILLQ